MQKLLLVLTLAALASGCSSNGTTVVEGVDLSVGMSLPGTDGEVTMTVFNWLSGFKCTVDEGRVKLKYKCAESNDWFGVVHTRVSKEVSATITPPPESDDADAGIAGAEEKKTEQP